MALSYVLDPTGTSTNNLVSNDIFNVTPGSNTAIVPTAGMYFSISLIVTNSINGTIMTRNVDYICIELSGEMTGKYGQEINGAVLWLGTTGVTSVSLQYQCLGGDTAYDNTLLQELIQNTTLTSQQLEWSNILNKPNAYTPNNHINMLSDIYGFEPLVYAIERLSKLVNLNNTVSYQSLMDWVTSQLANVNSTTNSLSLTQFATLLDPFQTNIYNQLLALENLIKENTPYTNKVLSSLIDSSDINITAYSTSSNILNVSVDYINFPNGFKVFWELDAGDIDIGNYYYPSAGSITVSVTSPESNNTNISTNLNGPLLFNTKLIFTALETYSNGGTILAWFDLNNFSISDLDRLAIISDTNEITNINSFNNSYIDRRYINPN